MIAPAAIIEIRRGPWAGRIGQVEAATIDGLAVRLRGPCGSERDCVVVQAGDVEVIDLRARVERRAA